MRRTITVGQAVSIYYALSNVQGDISASLGFKIARLESKLKPIFQEFEKTRDELIKKYGEEDKEREGQFQVPKERVPEFMEEVEEVQAETDVIEFPTFKVEEFDGMKLPKSFYTVMSDYIGTESEADTLAPSTNGSNRRKRRTKKSKLEAAD